MPKNTSSRLSDAARWAGLRSASRPCAGDQGAAAGAEHECEHHEQWVIARELEQDQRARDQAGRAAQHRLLSQTIQQHAGCQAGDDHSARERDEHAARTGQRNTGALAQCRQDAAEQRRNRAPHQDAEKSGPHQANRAGSCHAGHPFATNFPAV
jgi:hypothetical protein